MASEIGVKFAILCISSNQAPILTSKLNLSPFIVSGKLPVPVDERWRRWLGEFRTDDLSRCKLFFTAETQSEHANIIDSESSELRRRVADVFIALQLVGLLRVSFACVLTGAIVNRKVSLHSFHEIQRPRTNGKRSYPEITVARITRATLAAQSISTINRKINDYRLLRSGLRAFIKGVNEHDFFDRLYEFVRSLEALVLLDTQGRTSFAKRLQRIATKGPLIEEKYKNMYVLRNTASHFLIWSDELPVRSSKKSREQLADQLGLHAEVLASGILERILGNEMLLATFKSDASIRSFWALPEPELLDLWGPKLSHRKQS